MKTENVNAELKLAHFYWHDVLLFGESFHAVCNLGTVQEILPT